MGELLDENQRYYGFYRALVVDVDVIVESEKNDYGAIRVFCPDLMRPQKSKTGGSAGISPPPSPPSNIPPEQTILAFPGNTMTFYNTEDLEEKSAYMGSLWVPPKNSYIWIWFEAGNRDRAFYMSGFRYLNTKVPPENRGVDEPHKVITIIKTISGKSLVFSDSKDADRVQICGKKRMMKDPPCGDNQSVYNIEGNQTTILLNEIEGQNQILIKSYLNDYINFDIEKQSLECYFAGDIKIKCGGSFSIDAGNGYQLNAGSGGVISDTKGSTSINSKQISTISADSNVNVKAKASVLVDGNSGFLAQTNLSCVGKKPDVPGIQPSSGKEGKKL